MQRHRRGLGSALAAYFIVAAAGCHPSTGASEPAQRAGSHVESSPAASSRAFVADALWQEAKNGTELEWQRLANREGAVGLVNAAKLGNEWRLVALRCMPFAEDAVNALPFLCDSAKNAVKPDEQAVLEALHAIVSEPPRDTEELTIDIVTACRERLASVLGRADLAPAERDLASSAARLLEERVRRR